MAGEHKGFYRRINELPKIVSMEDAAFYTGCYVDWDKGGKKEVAIKTSACKNQVFRKVLSNASLKIEALYREKKPQASESILRNFMVKVWFWYDFLFGGDDFAWNERLNSKIAAVNVTNWQEYLFFYGVTLTGSDVLLLQCARDIDAEDEKKKLSDSFVLGVFSEVQIPEYIKPALKLNGSTGQNGAVGQNEVPQGNNDLRVSAASNQGGAVRIAMPRHEGRPSPSNPANQMPAQAPIAGAPANGIIRGQMPTQASMAGAQANVRQEKSYEELASMASSVVLILIHDNKGEVVGSGSGIMIGRNGYILTNNHVTRGGRAFTVRIEDDDQAYTTDEIIKYHSVLDLAIIRIQRELKPLPIYNGTQKLVRGQRVVAIGSPLGLFNSVSDGIISGFRKIDDVDMIQFTAPISHGSSGGAVLNMYGEVIGISTAGIDSGQNINLAMGYECINSFIRGFT
ncbi:MAG: trypsin-like peptidase domain-containing protein [Agathobacter sp.]|nr:trypsin-like peptidase domain-containing protein [Agathobacter sp.]